MSSNVQIFCELLRVAASCCELLLTDRVDGWCGGKQDLLVTRQRHVVGPVKQCCFTAPQDCDCDHHQGNWRKHMVAASGS